MLSPGNGNKTVYAQFSDLAGNPSAVANDAISLDTNPPPMISFVSTNASESAGMVTVQVTLSRSHSQLVSVQYFTANGSASDGADYTSASGLLQFSPGTTTQSFPMTILPDTLVELNETITLNLSDATNAVPAGAGTVTILDDDSPTISFANAAYSVGEAGGSASINVRLNAASGQTVTVRYIATNSTAIAGTDFVATNALLTFPPGETNVSFLVPILNDSSNELNETISLLLTNPTNATLAAPSSAVLTIVDDEPPSVFFSASTYYVAEATGFIIIGVWLNKPFLQDVSVNYRRWVGQRRRAWITTPPTAGWISAPAKRIAFPGNHFDNGARQTQLKTVHLALSNFHVGTPVCPVKPTSSSSTTRPPPA
jgi:hypothetical protein